MRWAESRKMPLRPTAHQMPPDDVLRAALDLLPVVIYVADAQGRIEFVNRRLFDVTGISPEEILAQAWIDLVHPDDREHIRDAWMKAMAVGKDVAARYRYRMKDGSYSWVLSLATPLRDDDGTVIRWFGTTMDIDPLVRAEQSAAERELALRASEQHYRALGESVSQIVWSANPQGWMDWYNRRWYEYTGQTLDEAVGWGWQATPHPADFPLVMEAWLRSIATGDPFDMELRLRGADGRYRWFLTRAEALRDDNGQIIRWYGTSTDIDEQRRAFERSRQIAQTLQDVFLPRSLPRRGDVRLSGAFLSAESGALVGGDWYDVIELRDGRLVVTIGDVSGHGVEASGTAGRLRQTLIAAVLDCDQPSALLRKMNQVLRFQEPTVATSLVGLIDMTAHSFIYASAGHPPPILATPSSEPVLLAYGGVPLGVEADPAYADHRVDIHEPDSVLVFYTDGVTEFDRNIEAAERTLMNAANAIARDPQATDAADELLRAALGTSLPRDDAAMLVAQLEPSNAGPGVDMVAREHFWRFHSSDAFTARRSRQELVRHLRRVTADDRSFFEAELIIGELLSNTVKHAPGLVQVRIDCNGPQPVITVRDCGPGHMPTEIGLPCDSLNENGRGLFLVHTLAREVQVRSVPGGTEIVATLPLRCRST